MPYVIAPEKQKHIGAIFWLASNFKLVKAALRNKADEQLSHDNVFHTILGMLEVETPVYNKSRDIIHG